MRLAIVISAKKDKRNWLDKCKGSCLRLIMDKQYVIFLFYLCIFGLGGANWGSISSGDILVGEGMRERMDGLILL